MDKVLIGVDIGGTTIKIGFFTQQGIILKKYEILTNKNDNGSQIIPDLVKSINEKIRDLAINKENIMGIGVGAPGFIVGDSGLVEEAVNIGWKKINLGSELSEQSQLPVFVGNDANLAALGENWMGSGNESRNFVAITLGTGVGGGIIANGQLLSGVNGTAGEIGHITVEPNGYPCNCGKNGCLETVASATGIAKQAMEIIDRRPQSNLGKHFQNQGGITAKDVFDLAGTGDRDSQQIVSRTGDVLGLVLSTIATIVNPSKIVIGGGVSKAGKPLLDTIQNSFNSYALKRLTNVCSIETAQLGNDAGIYGAAYLVKDKLVNKN
ncbi:ROK family glucokinase [Virgibacillus necropolis]|uniref:Glucokinase n=1 Tax=Virgibacillus necropolis TaxID=163877 RepID=A0A221MC82_9BACI|nr:ROK family glucokinase [Virgibacillus necropolis]ASN05237.1 glucokinase [Virgibacillus necropolis]